MDSAAWSEKRCRLCTEKFKTGSVYVDYELIYYSLQHRYNWSWEKSSKTAFTSTSTSNLLHIIRSDSQNSIWYQCIIKWEQLNLWSPFKNPPGKVHWALTYNQRTPFSLYLRPWARIRSPPACLRQCHLLCRLVRLSSWGFLPEKVFVFHALLQFLSGV